MPNHNQPPAEVAFLIMTRKKQDHLAKTMTPDKWERQRQAERISLSEHKTVPHLNSTMGGRYEGKELSYRGRQ